MQSGILLGAFVVLALGWGRDRWQVVQLRRALKRARSEALTAAVPVAPLLRTVIADCSDRFFKGSVKLESVLDEGAKSTLSSGQLSGTLRILIASAIEAAKAAGCDPLVRIELQKEGHHNLLTISHNGSAIEAEVLSALPLEIALNRSNGVNRMRLIV